MGGFGALAWLAIGAVGGWTIARLMVTAGDEALRGTASGMLGGILGGLATHLLWSSASETNNATVLFASVAGSLWLTWITCVVTSGRERRSRPRTPVVISPDLKAQPSPENEAQTLAVSARAG